MKKKLLIFIVTFFAISGCSSIYNFIDKNKLMHIQIGMSKTEIQQLFGTPGYRTMKGNQREEWKYLYGQYSGYDFLQFIFHCDTVESFDTWFVPENSLVPARESNSKEKDS